MRVAFVDSLDCSEMFFTRKTEVLCPTKNNRFYLISLGFNLIYSLRPHWIIVADLIIIIVIMFLLSFPAFYLL